MAGDPPVEATIEKVLSQPGEPWGDYPQKVTYDEVLFEGEGRTRKVYAPANGPVLVDGATVKGWFNDQKGHFSVAADRPQNAGGGRSQATSGGRDDATGQSIERQVAAKAAAEMAVAAGGDAPTLIANFEAYFDIVAAKIAGKSVATG